MRLPAAVIDDAKHAAVCVNVQWVPCGDVRRYRGVQEQMTSSANETAQCLASGIRGEHVFADTRRPAGTCLPGGIDDGCERTVAEQPVLSGMCQRDERGPITKDRKPERSERAHWPRYRCRR